MRPVPHLRACRLLGGLQGYMQGRLVGPYAPWQVAHQLLRSYRLCNPLLQQDVGARVQQLVGVGLWLGGSAAPIRLKRLLGA